MREYVSKHAKPTPYEREVLTIMQEECAEVIVQISKALRFGLKDGYPGGTETNLRAISRELGDLQAMIGLAREVGLVDDKAMRDGATEKIDRLAQYMQASREAQP